MTNQLNAVARALVEPGKGILAADESSGTIKKRFDAISVESTEANRRDYRELMFRSPDANRYISGVILYDETIRQKGKDGTPLVEVLKARGIHPGIKVDTGAVALAGSPKEKVTQGLDGLRERLAEYAKLGAKFAKWRAVIEIGPGMPGRQCLVANAEALARYAALCQEAGIVPIVEPEVLMDGDHDICRCMEATEAAHAEVFAALRLHRVALEGMLLKPNMVLPGKKCAKQNSHKEVAAATIELFRRSVPAAVPGIVFLSGGQSDEDATAHLDEMNKLGGHPWKLSFSYGRALQHVVQVTWKGNAANTAAAQKAFDVRAKLNSLATLGKYSAAMEKELATV